ncbi:MAG: insulinase family protein [Spirochaetales bacterium]|nr:insulinase family protein [Spirochaetales bacterium]
MRNGVRVLSEKVQTTETISLGYWFLTGSRDESAHERGYSHFLEHMLFKGTKRRTAFQIARDIDRVGGVLNAYTDKELCCYYCVVPRDQIRLSMDVLNDMVFHSVFNEKEIENEKGVIINEILSIQDSPDELAHELFLKNFYRDHPLSRNVTGEVADINGVTRKSLVDFYSLRYIPSLMIVSIVGNFDEQEVSDHLAALENLPEVNGAPFNRARPVHTHDFQYVKSPFTQVQVYAGIDCPEIAQKKYFYQSLVFSTLFGESMSSRLFQKIREELGLCYAVNSFRSFYSDTASLNVYVNTKAETLYMLLKTLNDEFGRLVSEQVTQMETEDAKSHLKGSLLLAREDMELRMKRIVKMFLILHQTMDFDESVHHLEKVTCTDVNDFINRFIHPRQINALAFGKIKKSETKMKGFDF